MNNPNPNCDRGPAEDPDAALDHQKFIDEVFDLVATRRTQIREWFEAQGFAEVLIRELPQRAPDAWECFMLRSSNDESPTWAQLRALVMRLAGEMQCSVHADEFCGVVWGDRIGRPQA